MTILDLLKADHDKVAKLLKQLEETTERAEKTRTEVFTQMKDELTVHAEFEEQRFYPTLKEEDESEDITREGYEEHHVIKVLLEEIAAMDPADPQWLAKLTVLKENIEHHVEEEEGEMFADAKKVYTKEELEALGVEYEEVKKAALK